MHVDDNPHNNSLDNLRWGTRQENALDSALKKRCAQQVIDASTAKTIIEMRKNGVRGAEVARLFGISPQRVCDVLKGRSAIARML